MTAASPLRRTLGVVVGLNATMCAVEVVLALRFNSTSLLADSADFLEDATINALALGGLAWTAGARRSLGRILSGVLLAPSVAALTMVAVRIARPVLPSAEGVGATAIAALLVNGLCAVLLARHRHEGGSLTRAAFLSARNDLLVSVAVTAGAVAVAATHSNVPDLVVGALIALLGFDAAREVWEAAALEGRSDAR